MAGIMNKPHRSQPKHQVQTATGRTWNYDVQQRGGPGHALVIGNDYCPACPNCRKLLRVYGANNESKKVLGEILRGIGWVQVTRSAWLCDECGQDPFAVQTIADGTAMQSGRMSLAQMAGMGGGGYPPPYGAPMPPGFAPMPGYPQQPGYPPQGAPAPGFPPAAGYAPPGAPGAPGAPPAYPPQMPPPQAPPQMQQHAPPPQMQQPAPQMQQPAPQGAPGTAQHAQAPSRPMPSSSHGAMGTAFHANLQTPARPRGQPQSAPPQPQAPSPPPQEVYTAQHGYAAQPEAPQYMQQPPQTAQQFAPQPPPPQFPAPIHAPPPYAPPPAAAAPQGAPQRPRQRIADWRAHAGAAPQPAQLPYAQPAYAPPTPAFDGPPAFEAAPAFALPNGQPPGDYGRAMAVANGSAGAPQPALAPPPTAAPLPPGPADVMSGDVPPGAMPMGPGAPEPQQQ